MSRQVPPEIMRLAQRMFAGHTGLSLDQLRAFFAARAVSVEPPPDSDKPRKTLLERGLSALPHAEQVRALWSLLDYAGAMRHGYPTHAQKAELRTWLENG